jgi:lysophospholipase
VQEGRAAVLGLTLSAPFLGTKLEVPGWKKCFAHALSKSWPGFSMPMGLDPTLLSRSADVVSAYANDPLVLTRATARWYTETLLAQERAVREASSVACPLLLIHGADDRVANPETARRFFDRAASRDKELRVWAGLRHEPLNEPEGGEVQAVILDWISKHS